MTHSNTTHGGRVEAISAAVQTDVSKAMAMVFKDGELVGLVHCYTTLWATCDLIMANAALEAPVVSIVFEGIGDPYAKAHSFQLTSDAWQAMGFDDEDTFCEHFLPSIGLTALEGETDAN